MKAALFSVVLSLSALCICTYAQSGLPSKCKPCLFYGGDLNPSDPNAFGFYDESTVNVTAQTFGAIRVPKGRVLLIEGILFQIQFDGFDKLDPQEGDWEIRTDIYNNGGTLVASGGGQVAVQPTGRSFWGPENTVAVKVDPPVQISGGNSYGGTVYWFNLTPLCTNSRDSACKAAAYFASNSTQLTNSFRSFAQPGGEIVTESVHYGYDWQQCPGAVGNQCLALSFGLMGKVLQ
jgi:hypothetical protein